MNACSAVFHGSTLLVLFVVPALAGVGPTKLPGSTFQDWNGSLVQAELKDGSLLNEYEAKTRSGSVDGASLVVSFFPRFNCYPALSVTFEAGAGLDGGLNAMELQIDRKKVDFPVLLDVDTNADRYSLNADLAANAAVLALLDSGSRASVKLFSSESEGLGGGNSESGQEGQAGVQIEFSLLGSKLATQSVQNHCKAHIPIAYEN